MKILASKTEPAEYEFVVQTDETTQATARINQRELYVLENWHRIYDAMLAKPPDERESHKYQENGAGPNGKEKHHHHHQNGSAETNGHGTSSAENDNDFSSTASDSEKSDTSSPYGSSENVNASSSAEQIEHSKVEINEELRQVWSLDENERKKRINKLLLKWHPDKNPGQEKFAAEVFKHLKKQIELFKTDPFLAGLYRSSYSPYTGGFGSSSAYGTSSGASTATSDDYKSRSGRYGSFDDLHRKAGASSPTGGGGGASSPHSSPSREGSMGGGGGMGTNGSSSAYDSYERTAPGASNLGRAGSFRQEWERRRQQKRQAAAGASSDPSMCYLFKELKYIYSSPKPK